MNDIFTDECQARYCNNSCLSVRMSFYDLEGLQLESSNVVDIQTQRRSCNPESKGPKVRVRQPKWVNSKKMVGYFRLAV